MFKSSFLYFNLCPLPLVLSLESTKDSLALSSLGTTRHTLRSSHSRPFHWAYSSLSSSHQYQRAPALTQYSRCVPPGLGRAEGSSPSTLWRHSSQCSLGGCWSPLLAHVYPELFLGKRSLKNVACPFSTEGKEMYGTEFHILGLTLLSVLCFI